MGEEVGAPAPVTLRITVGREGRAEALSVRSRALQLQAGEARVSSDAIAGMLSFVFLEPYYSSICVFESCVCMYKTLSLIYFFYNFLFSSIKVCYMPFRMTRVMSGAPIEMKLDIQAFYCGPSVERIRSTAWKISSRITVISSATGHIKL